ncbi:MAG: NAD(P)H-hydrate epimerase [Fidelibacterota bacterium]
MSHPVLTVAQMREVDRLMVEEYGISLEQMMEQAGRNLSDLAVQWLQSQTDRQPPYDLVVVCGTGNNGGGGMTAARYLSNRGHAVTVVLAGETGRLKPVPKIRWQTLQHCPVDKIVGWKPSRKAIFANADLIIDALLGYGLTGAPRGIAAQYIEDIIQAGNRRLLALDVPSGLDLDSGKPYDLCLPAAATMTLALPKVGLTKATAKPYVGQLYLADIGVPPQLYRHLGLPEQILFQNQALRLITED